MGARILVLGLVSALVLGGLFAVLRPDAPATTPTGRSFGVEIGADGMAPREVRAREGDRVTITFASDRPLEVHIHGYDVERGVEPGGTTVVSFDAYLTGRFPVEDHETGEGLGLLVVEPR